MEHNDIEVSPTINNTYRVVKMVKYKDVIIPRGYTTNGADVPRILWWIVPPFKPKYLPAVIVHDFLCAKKQFKKADDYFEEILFTIEKSLKTRAMVRAVRAYHFIRYGVK